jgi:DNA-binding MarR family transcriptional regulator
VRRSANLADRLNLIVETTPEGLTVAQGLRTIVHRHEKAWIRSLSDADLRNFIEQMHRIQDGLAPDPGSGG